MPDEKEQNLKKPTHKTPNYKNPPQTTAMNNNNKTNKKPKALTKHQQGLTLTAENALKNLHKISKYNFKYAALKLLPSASAEFH